MRIDELAVLSIVQARARTNNRTRVAFERALHHRIAARGVFLQNALTSTRQQVHVRVEMARRGRRLWGTARISR
eukprot:6201507-Pleurochrysis_carterae.AAC.4